MARRRFFVKEVAQGRAEVAGDQAHHLARVLRVESGQLYEISDNQQVYLAAVEAVRKDLVSFAIVERIETAAPAVHATLFASLVKFDRFEWMLEKATELGVDRIVPVQAERSEKGLLAAARNRLERWQRVVREASEQSRRDYLPQVSEPIPFADALAMAADYRYVLEEAGARSLLSLLPPSRAPADRVALFVGPEGGWTDRDRQAFQSSGWTPASLGRDILRAETAAIAAIAIVQAAWTACA
jgi:16S rRNA (uracil1498-N3)-methyltransferase